MYEYEPKEKLIDNLLSASSFVKRTLLTLLTKSSHFPILVELFIYS